MKYYCYNTFPVLELLPYVILNENIKYLHLKNNVWEIL